MALSVLQVTHQENLGTGSAVSPSITTTPGSLLVAVCRIGGNALWTQADGDVTDSKGGTWHLAVSGATASPGRYANIYYEVGGPRGSSHTVTLDPVNGPGAEDCTISLAEVAGADAISPFDATTSGSAADATSPLSVTAGGAIVGNQIAFYAATVRNGTLETWTLPSGYTDIFTEPDGATLAASTACYKIGETGTPTVSASFTGAITSASEAFATFKEASAVSSPPPAAPFFGAFSWLWQTPHGTDPIVVTALDVVPASPLPLVEWLRRRHDYETEQQPRHLLDVSTTQSVDAPNPQPLPTVEWLRRRPDYEADQQPRHLVDVSETQGVPLPTPLPTVVWLRRRPDYEVEQQPRRLLDITVTQSVDSPTGAPVIRIEFLPRFIGQQARGLPVDVLAPAVTPDNPTGNVTQTPTFPTYAREPWQPRRLVDTSITQSVDSPPGIAPQPSPVPRPRWQGQQAVPLAVDLLAPVTGPFGAVQQVAGYQRITTWQQWLQAHDLDTSITQSVDSPPGIGRPQPWVVPAARSAQWDQAVPGPIVAPDQQPNPQFNTAVYLRQAAAFQAWQKSPQFLFPSVDSPPLSGPYPTAPYRRPVPPTPYRLPQILALPPTFFPDTNPDIIFGREPGVILGTEPAPVYGREESVLVGAEDEPIYGREP